MDKPERTEEERREKARALSAVLVPVLKLQKANSTGDDLTSYPPYAEGVSRPGVSRLSPVPEEWDDIPGGKVYDLEFGGEEDDPPVYDPEVGRNNAQAPDAAAQGGRDEGQDAVKEGVSVLVDEMPSNDVDTLNRLVRAAMDKPERTEEERRD
eukprot:jgi/Mesvir1/24153/Mv10870-RA.1